MKKLLALFMIVSLGAAFTACDDDDKPVDVPHENDANSLTWYFTGPVKVEQQDKSVYTHKKNVITKVAFNSDHSKCDVTVYNVSFASNMPVQINMHIVGLAVKQVSGGYEITGDDIVPTYGGKEFPRYTVYGFSATATTTTLGLKMTCGGGEDYPYPVTYAGIGYDLQEGDIKEEEANNNDEFLEGSFTGLMQVVQTDGPTFKDEDVRIDVLLDKENDTYTLEFVQVRFAEGMRDPVDMTVRGIEYKWENGILKFTGEDLIPLSGTTPMAGFTITGFGGGINGKELGFTTKCGNFPVSYSGTLVETEN